MEKGSISFLTDNHKELLCRASRFLISLHERDLITPIILLYPTAQPVSFW